MLYYMLHTISISCMFEVDHGLQEGYEPRRILPVIFMVVAFSATHVVTFQDQGPKSICCEAPLGFRV